MTKNFPKSMIKTKFKIQGAQKTPSKVDTKKICIKDYQIYTAKKIKDKNKLGNWRQSSVVEHLPSMCEDLG
jgi:hypothetical protein